MELEQAIYMYRKGELSLFEAARLLDIHPREFVDILRESNIAIEQ